MKGKQSIVVCIKRWMGILSVVFYLTGNIYAQGVADTAKLYAETIKQEKLKNHLTVLASDEYEGRETTKPGQKKAAAYIANQFKKIGLLPYKDTSYFQQFPVIIKQQEKITISISGKEYVQGIDYYGFSGIPEQSIITEELICLGYGINSNRFNDYKRKKIKGKALLLFSGEPYLTDSIALATGKKGLSPYSNDALKIAVAEIMDAQVLFMVSKNIEDDIKKNKRKIHSETMKLEEDVLQEKPEKTMPVIYISAAMANQLLMKKGETVEAIKKEIITKQKPVAIKTKIPIAITIKNNYKKAWAENVLGYLPGRDRQEELLIITAHYDHIGVDEFKEGDKIYNGADDNGTGTSAVLELAAAFMKAKREGKTPRRSILFMTVSGEEKGLLGSKYYTAHPEFSLEKTIANLNIDMIGRWDEKHKDSTNYVYIIGSDKISTELHQINESANKRYTGIKLDYTFNDLNDKNRFYYRSDHYNFVKKGIPVIFYFNGVHADYHRASDEISKIDFGLAENRTRLVFYTAWELVNRTNRIRKDVK